MSKSPKSWRIVYVPYYKCGDTTPNNAKNLTVQTEFPLKLSKKSGSTVISPEMNFTT